MVPSTTASLHDLGFGNTLAGISDFCPDIDSRAVRVGGPKTLDVETVVSLKPDLVIANKEENSRADLEAMAEAGLRVWITFPTTVRASLDDLWSIARLFRSQPAVQALTLLEKSVEWAKMAAASQSLTRCFVPIWQEQTPEGGWWMAFNGSTYPGDLLSLFNVENVFADRQRRYPLRADLGLGAPEPPGERDTRYPRVTLDEIIAAAPEIILLPDEPYPYTQQHVFEAARIFADTPAARAGRIYALDGRLLMWHGTYLARSLEELPAFLVHSS